MRQHESCYVKEEVMSAVFIQILQQREQDSVVIRFSLAPLSCFSRNRGDLNVHALP